MVRLVFRPYTQVRRTICTSVSLRSSTRVSSGFVPTGNSSPSFGSQRDRSRCTYSCPRSAPRRESEVPPFSLSPTPTGLEVHPRLAQPLISIFLQVMAPPDPECVSPLERTVSLGLRWTYPKSRPGLAESARICADSLGSHILNVRASVYPFIRIVTVNIDIYY